MLENVRSRVGNTPAVEAIELIAAGDKIIVSVKAPDVGVPIDGAENEFRGEACIVYTLRDGRIVRIDDYLHRADALKATAASITWD